METPPGKEASRKVFRMHPFMPQRGSARNALGGRNIASLHSLPIPNDAVLTPGGREVFRRTRRHPATCNAIAAAWAFGAEMEG